MKRPNWSNKLMINGAVLHYVWIMIPQHTYNHLTFSKCLHLEPHVECSLDVKKSNQYHVYLLNNIDVRWTHYDMTEEFLNEIQTATILNWVYAFNYMETYQR